MEEPGETLFSKQIGRRHSAHHTAQYQTRCLIHGAGFMARANPHRGQLANTYKRERLSYGLSRVDARKVPGEAGSHVEKKGQLDVDPEFRDTSKPSSPLRYPSREVATVLLLLLDNVLPLAFPALKFWHSMFALLRDLGTGP